jgi:hypothetical protein
MNQLAVRLSCSLHTTHRNLFLYKVAISSRSSLSRNRIFFFLDSGVMAEADPGFEVRGGAIKNIAPSGGRREHFWGVFRVKNHDCTPKNHIISNFMGGGGAPPGIRPWMGDMGL